MLLQHTIDPAPAAELARQVEKFLQSGGQIERLPGPKFTPPPPRITPTPTQKGPRKPLVSASIQLYRQHGPGLIDMLERGQSFSEMGRHVGQSAEFVIRCLDWFGIDARTRRAEIKASEDAEMIDSIRVMAADGHSIRFTARHLGISYGALRFHAEKHGIRFSGQRS
ncbi:hypothetical protein [Halopseudomonas bauzanensis]|uniref:hypothetical protein n=1 Tax=Halopseudomonas bauzanensis TaxID=653930 RepID=UPI002555A6A2|nr:hypothetical protein [Halopseudomonas bauzanensis]